MHYYLFAVKLDRCAGSYNTLKLIVMSHKVCALSKTEDLSTHVFNMITEKN